MAKRRPVLISVIAVFQILPILLLPPKLYPGMSRLFLVPPLLIFALIAWLLLTFRPQGRTLTIFLQGFNIIVRTLITLAHVVPSKQVGTPADIPLLVTSVVSVILSAAILYYVDQPEMQLLFEA